MDVSRPGTAAQWSAQLGLLAVIILFCVPLFFGLDGWDQRNDEAIYSYAVDRILETGNWLTPRAIPDDGPFLEKPPLKFWLVAGAIKAGVLPFDDRGMRAVDAVLGAAAFIYVFWFGRRVAGVIAGLVSVFLLFEFEPLIFNHGIRGNHMDAMLLLASCGGLFHFVRWIDTHAGRARAHAYAVAGCFAAAFLTKFVAAFFLPIVCVLALAIRPDARATRRARWREWIVPAAAVLTAIAPWFVYQTVRDGSYFWDTILLEHVVTRFTGTLAASHLQPWHHYFTMTWSELGYSQSQIIFALGLVALGWRAWRGRDWLARVMLLWWFVPFALMSIGTSKLFYYAYPFLPPLAIGGGLASAEIIEWIGVRAPVWMGRFWPRGLSATGQASRLATRRGRVLAIVGAIALALAAWTLVAGSLTIEPGGVRLFRNSSVVRPLVVGVVLWHFAGLSGVVFRMIGVWLVVLILPLSWYMPRVHRLSSIDHPLRTARDCALAVQASGAHVGTGVLMASGDLHHAFFYYLRRLGPWLRPERGQPDDLRRRFEVSGEQTPVILSADDYVRLGGTLERVAHGASNASIITTPEAVGLTRGLPPGIVIGDLVVILFPGPFESCTGPVALAGATALKAVAR